MSTRPTLPLELIFQIFDSLNGHKNTLSVCSLVSRWWLVSAQSRLFRSIRLQSVRDSDADEEVTLSYFLWFLEDAPKICSYVQELHVSPSGFWVPSVYLHGDSDFIAVIRKLPSLHTLSIEALRLLPTITPWEFAHPLSSIQTLRIRGLFAVDAALHQFLSLFSVQDVLDVRRVHSRSDNVAVDLSPPDLEYPVRSFALLDDFRGHPFLDAVSNRKFTRLATLSVEIDRHDFSIQRLDRLNQFLTRNGVNLHYLRLDGLWKCNSNLSGWDVPHLATLCPDLQTIHFTFYAIRDDPSPRGQGGLLITPCNAKFISQVILSAPQTLSCIIFDILVDTKPLINARQHDTRHWEDICAALDALPPSTTLKFVTHNNMNEEPFQGTFAGSFIPLPPQEQRFLTSVFAGDHLAVHRCIQLA